MTGRGAVLVVCTANVCRSPLAERLLASRAAASGLPIAVGSAGIRALEGSPMCAVSAAELPAGEDAGHVARQIDRALIESADLVLTMEREHRGEVVRTVPGSQGKVFTLREAVALADGLVARDRDGLPDLQALARAMHGLRGLVPIPADPEPPRRWFRRAAEPADPLTITDGHGDDDATHRAAAARVRAFADAFGAAAVVLLRA